MKSQCVLFFPPTGVYFWQCLCTLSVAGEHFALIIQWHSIVFLCTDSFVRNLVPVRVWCIDFSKCTYCSHLSEDGVPSQFHFIQFIFRLFMQLYLESSCSHDFPWPRRVLVKVLNQVLEGRLSKADKNIRECCLRLINSHGIACPAPLRILWWSNKMGITKLVAQCNNEF